MRGGYYLLVKQHFQREGDRSPSAPFSVGFLYLDRGLVGLCSSKEEKYIIRGPFLVHQVLDYFPSTSVSSGHGSEDSLTLGP